MLEFLRIRECAWTNASWNGKEVERGASKNRKKRYKRSKYKWKNDARGVSRDRKKDARVASKEGKKDVKWDGLKD